MMEDKIVVGQILFKEIKNKYAPDEITQVLVSKVGNKYFYVDEDKNIPIDKYTLKHQDKNWTQANFQLYKSKQEVLDENERKRLVNLVRQNFEWTQGDKNYTLEQMKQVVKILNL